MGESPVIIDSEPDCSSFFFKILICLFGCSGSSLLCRISLVAVSEGYSLVMMHGLLIAVASLVHLL